MSDQTTLDRVTKTLEGLGHDADLINMTTRFDDDLDISSLDHVDMIMAVEKEFNISISDDDAEEIENVAQLVGHIDHCLESEKQILVKKRPFNTPARHVDDSF